MAYTEFYCQSGGSNLNAGSTTNNTAAYTSTNGNWNGSTTFTPADTQLASLVNVGDWASVYLDAATVGVFIARVATVNQTGGNITSIVLDSTAQMGTAPTSSSTGRTMKVGGAWKGPNGSVTFPFGIGSMAALKDVAGDLPRINLKNDGTYSISAVISVTGSGPLWIQGYSSSPDDQGKATIDTSTNTVGGITNSGSNINLVDLIVSSSATSGSSDGIAMSGGGDDITRCVVHGFRGNGFNLGQSTYVKECEAYDNNKANAASTAGFKCSSSSFFENCISHDNTGSNTDGFTGIAGATPLTFVNCIADTNGRHGFSIQLNTSPSALFLNCDAYNNGTDGIKNLLTTTNSFVNIKNCNFIKNGGYGINSALTTGRWFGNIDNCGFGSGTQANGLGTTNNTDLVEITGSVTYASNVTPWTDPGNGDFRINLSAARTAGRGAFTETAPSYAGTVGYPDIGAAQSLCTAISMAGLFTILPMLMIALHV